MSLLPGDVMRPALRVVVVVVAPPADEFGLPRNAAYNDVVTAALGNTAVGGSQACVNAMASAFQVIDTALRGTPSQQAAIASQLYSCAPPSTLDDVKLLASNLAGTVMGVIQCACGAAGGGAGGAGHDFRVQATTTVCHATNRARLC